MVDMAKAFGVLANQGEQVDLISYLKIKNSILETIDEPKVKSVRCLNSGISYIISDILSDNFARTWAFGPNSYLEIPGYKVAVKTGTTNDKRDNWTVGYTPEFLVVVWVGNNDNSPMNPYLTSGITGAAPIWNRVMSFLLKNYGSNNWYQKPDNVVEKICYFGRKEYFLKGTENKVNCQASLITSTPTP
jgi:membrane peptidoglycan carboxypeptidase